jgi:hypothetical protein
MTANADNREALFKLGRPALQTLIGRLPRMHRLNCGPVPDWALAMVVPLTCNRRMVPLLVDR